ncbi:hypothetical protein [Haloarchaeobius sp. DFWS5]|uniref:hypothetical protein n=1 Tax=Haloarchaeobius sp. DFWS5 TaxID=3446114 RepID=UPI003EBDA6F3
MIHTRSRASSPFRPFIVLCFVIFSVMMYLLIGPAILGPIGEVAKDSEGTDGQGFSVGDGYVDQAGSIALVQIPTLVIGSVAVWALLALLVALAYVGVV